MIPGFVSKMSEITVASATTILSPDADILIVTGATQIETIVPALGKQCDQFLVVIPVTGAVTLGTAGNILVGIVMAVNRAVFMVYRKSTDKWYINSGV